MTPAREDSALASGCLTVRPIRRRCAPPSTRAPSVPSHLPMSLRAVSRWSALTKTRLSCTRAAAAPPHPELRARWK